MLSMEFIPTSSSEYDHEENSTANLSVNTISNTLKNTINTTFETTASSTKPLNYSTVPESIKFIPQPPVQFFYSLQVIYIIIYVYIFNILFI